MPHSSAMKPDTSEPINPTLRQVLPDPIDWKVITILVLSCLVVTANYYLKDSRNLIWMCSAADAVIGTTAPATESAPPRRAMRGRDISNGPAGQWYRRVFEQDGRKMLWRNTYWSLSISVFYFILPVIVIKLFLREQLRDYGLKLTGWYRKSWVYLLGLGIVIPLVFLFGRTTSFQNTYPFYKGAARSWSDLIAWELIYGLQFFTLEFFFRGVMIHGVKHRLGFYSVLIMTIPYTMIHFGKPFPETLGAIIAGLFLGTLSLWTRSIWLGVAIHCTVAWSMDLVALWNKGQLQTLFE